MKPHVSVIPAAPLRRRPSPSLVRHLLPSLAAIVVLFGAACASPFAPASAVAHVRLHNASEFDLESIRFSCGAEPVHLSRLNAHTRSSYRETPVAYDVAYVEALIQGIRYATPMYSFADHARLPGGTYTYRITVDTTHRSLQVVAIAD